MASLLVQHPIYEAHIWRYVVKSHAGRSSDEVRPTWCHIPQSRRDAHRKIVKLDDYQRVWNVVYELGSGASVNGSPRVDMAMARAWNPGKVH